MDKPNIIRFDFDFKGNKIKFVVSHMVFYGSLHKPKAE